MNCSDELLLSDPPLASALNSRYNGALAQHQSAIYDANALGQPGSPVSQVYTSACKPESAYWHQASEYNVNPVSEHFFLFFSFSTKTQAKLHVPKFELQIAFIISDLIRSDDCGGEWNSTR